MQSVLVDIYNFCHRNKQLARNQFSSTSSDSPSLVSRQLSSTSSEYNEISPHINTDDIFHPESDDKHNVVPFSPVYSDPNTVSAMQFPPYYRKSSNQSIGDSTPAIDVSKSTQKEILDAISSQAHELPKNEQSVHILNKPTLNSSDRRASRFSVTKILDSLGTHAAGVANKLVSATSLDSSKLKKAPQPKDEQKNEIVEIELETNTNTMLSERISPVANEPLVNGDDGSFEQHNDIENIRTRDTSQQHEKEFASSGLRDEGEAMSILKLASLNVPTTEINVPNQIPNSEQHFETDKREEIFQHMLSPSSSIAHEEPAEASKFIGTESMSHAEMFVRDEASKSLIEYPYYFTLVI